MKTISGLLQHVRPNSADPFLSHPRRFLPDSIGLCAPGAFTDRWTGIKVPCSALPKDALVVTVKETRGRGWRAGLRVLRANKGPANRKCYRLTDTLPSRPLNRIHLFAYYANELLKV